MKANARLTYLRRGTSCIREEGVVVLDAREHKPLTWIFSITLVPMEQIA
jgi:hypothetical protein